MPHSDLHLKQNTPAVSIGMPIYNESRFIQKTIESLIRQSYTKFELTISDNASTDKTEEICRKYAAKDKRIKYIRCENNLGATLNFLNALNLSSAPYFFWASGHDMWHPDFICQCVYLLESQPEVILAYPRTILIDQDDKELEITPDQIDTRGMSALQSYCHLIWNLHWCNMFYGIHRTKEIKKCFTVKEIYGPDNLILASLALRGAIAQVKEPLYYRRINRPEEGSDERKRRQLISLYPNTAKFNKSGTELFCELRNEYLKSVISSSLNLREKIIAIISTVKCFKQRFGVNIIRYK